MSGILPYLVGVALAATLAVLIAGVLTMLRGGEFNKKYGNVLMRFRVLFQFVAIVIFILWLLARGG